MRPYNPIAIEEKWQKVWEKEGTYNVDLNDQTKPKYYAFSMLPGITGAGIHIGHGRTYQFSDIKARFKRQQGYNAYHPIGWDSFGLPVENYAIKIGKKPREAHDEAKQNFTRQLKRLGYSYDWSKEISTADPEYYKWTQWIFTQLYKNDLAYQKESPQWWCETDQTVLANEQVEGGKCWRCGNPVTKRNLKQWFFKITEYADEMLEATDALDWTEMVKTMQKNWIGKSEGAEVTFTVDNSEETLTTFTTRPDTLFGVSFIALAPEHPLAQSLAKQEHKEAVNDYIKSATRQSDVERMNESREKTGVFTGSYAVNPVNNKKVQIWIADYVLAGYGTGAVMGVPGHDERDYAFADKFDLPIIKVLTQHDKDEAVLQNSDQFDGFSSAQAKQDIVAHLEAQDRAHNRTIYKMRDWLVSRQRYWGAPIPIIHCKTHGAVAVPDSDLPVVLPEVEDFKPRGGDTSVLASVEEWVNAPCPTCGEPGKRETDTLDGYACSSWYWLRYADPFNTEQAWDPETANYWQPVDYYNGADHAVAHLLYSRFWTRFFYKQGLVPDPEPFKQVMYNAYIMAPGGEKMSKSKGNVIDPLEIMDSGYGADSLRIYEMFIAPYDIDAPWDTQGVPGMFRFLNRLWTLVNEYIESGDTVAVNNDTFDEVLEVAHKTVKKVTEDIEGNKFNTAIASMMEAVNAYYKLKKDDSMAHRSSWKFAIESLLQILAPFAPHITEELWHMLGNTATIHRDTWPKWDKAYTQTVQANIAVQVNGKLRATIPIAPTDSEDGIKEAALNDETVKKYLDGKSPKRVIYVPGKIVNIVV